MEGWRAVGGMQIHVAVLATLVALLASPRAHAEVRISDGPAGSVIVEAHQATIQDVLDALGRARKLRVNSPAALSGNVTGTYSGTLPRVLARLLEGYDCVIRSSSAGLELTVVSDSTSNNTVPSGVAVVMPAHQAVSSNVDADEESALAKATKVRPDSQPPRTALRPPATAAAPEAGFGNRGAALGSALPTVARVSTNVDLDEEKIQ